MAVYPATAVIRATASTGRAGKCPSHSRAAKPGMATSSRPWLVRDRARKRRMAIESFFKSLVLLYKSGHVVDVFAVVGHAEFARQRVVDQAGALDVPQPGVAGAGAHFCGFDQRSEEHTSELQSRGHLVCRLLLEKKKNNQQHVKYQQQTRLS